ncbi:hypothetical protein [Deinococcus sp. DB0503]|uniref:hypothetical protein n=1 Tax=Deinococcus sp. DB0503 TaxID=2479203 RepID=UPI0018DFC83A|nr:hypothetical protein [Deinococcus sp. DB0503]MBI0445244.1 hypothetical protein [Deinococcus sp. DB0503]
MCRPAARRTDAQVLKFQPGAPRGVAALDGGNGGQHPQTPPFGSEERLQFGQTVLELRGHQGDFTGEEVRCSVQAAVQHRNAARSRQSLREVLPAW